MYLGAGSHPIPLKKSHILCLVWVKTTRKLELWRGKILETVAPILRAVPRPSQTSPAHSPPTLAALIGNRLQHNTTAVIHTRQSGCWIDSSGFIKTKQGHFVLGVPAVKASNTDPGDKGYNLLWSFAGLCWPHTMPFYLCGWVVSNSGQKPWKEESFQKYNFCYCYYS